MAFPQHNSLRKEEFLSRSDLPEYAGIAEQRPKTVFKHLERCSPIFFFIYSIKSFAKQITNLHYLRATLQLLIGQGDKEQKLCLRRGH